MSRHQLWCLRHGATEWAVAHRHTGRTDLPLLPEGEIEARSRAERLAAHEFARVLVSPLQRARRTAELAGVAEGASERADLVEWHYGEAEGLTTPELRERLDPAWTVWDGEVPGGETPEDVGTRADRVLAEAREVDGDVLLVAHGHLLRVLTARWLGQPARFGRHLRFPTAGLAVLGWERETPVLLELSPPPRP